MNKQEYKIFSGLIRQNLINPATVGLATTAVAIGFKAVIYCDFPILPSRIRKTHLAAKKNPITLAARGLISCPIYSRMDIRGMWLRGK